MKKVLIIENTPEVATLIELILEQVGFEVVHSIDLEWIKKLVYAEEVDIVSCDIMLPGISGMDIAKEIRKLNKTIPIIMISALKDNEIKKRCFEIGINYYIVKGGEFNKEVKTVFGQYL